MNSRTRPVGELVDTTGRTAKVWWTKSFDRESPIQEGWESRGGATVRVSRPKLFSERAHGVIVRRITDSVGGNENEGSIQGRDCRCRSVELGRDGDGVWFA